VAFSCLSNHLHILLWAEDAYQLSGFMGYFNSKVAKEVNRLSDWSDHVWARRYRAILVSDEPAVQTAWSTF
jgi:REP element-mobilizing transposase RayT